MRTAYGYVLQGPDGCLYPETLRAHGFESWAEAYGFVGQILGEEWRDRFWKRWSPSITSARRRGWRIVKVKLVPEAKARAPRRFRQMTERETLLLYWLLRAYESGHRQGWEEGPSVRETMDGIHSVLCNEGFGPNLPAAKELLSSPAWKP